MSMNPSQVVNIKWEIITFMVVVFFLFFSWAFCVVLMCLEKTQDLFVTMKCYILSPSYSEAMRYSGYILEGGRSGGGSDGSIIQCGRTNEIFLD